MDCIHLAGATEMIGATKSTEKMGKAETNDNRNEHREKFEISHLFLLSAPQIEKNTIGVRYRCQIIPTACITP